MQCSHTRLALKYLNHCRILLPAGVLAILGILFTSMFAPVFVRDMRLALEGAKTVAMVTGKGLAAVGNPNRVAASLVLAHGGGRRRPARMLSYEFTVAGRKYSGTEPVSVEEWNAAVAGQPMEVIYLPSNPAIHRAGKPMWRTSDFLFFAVGALALVAALVLFLRAIANVRQRVSLIANGLPALGIVEQLSIDKQESDRSGRMCLTLLKYKFLTDARGVQQLHDGELRSNIPHIKRQLRAGDTVLVLYDEHDPRRNEIDWFNARANDREQLVAAAAERSRRS